MSAAFIKGVGEHLPNARLTFDKFHVVAHTSKALKIYMPEDVTLGWHPLSSDWDGLVCGIQVSHFHSYTFDGDKISASQYEEGNQRCDAGRDEEGAGGCYI